MGGENKSTTGLHRDRVLTVNIRERNNKVRGRKVRVVLFDFQRGGKQTVTVASAITRINKYMPPLHGYTE